MVVGLAGCGRWGKHILRDLRTLGCEVPVVARSAASRSRAEEGGASAVVPDLASLPRIDGLVVATTTSSHAVVIDEALGLGVPVFCEKPLCGDPTTAAMLAERAPDRLFVMDKWRYHPGVHELATIARERRLGAIVGLRTVRAGWGSPHDDVDIVWVVAPHDLAIALEVMGAVPEPVAGVAESQAGVATLLHGVLRGDGWWHVLEASSRSPERTRRVELQCGEGVAVLAGGWDEHITVYRPGGGGGGDGERIETPGELPLLAELRAFVEHLDGGPPPKSSAAEGAAIVAAIASLRQLAGA